MRTKVQKCIKLLIERGANLNLADDSGKSGHDYLKGSDIEALVDIWVPESTRLEGRISSDSTKAFEDHGDRHEISPPVMAANTLGWDWD